MNLARSLSFAVALAAIGTAQAGWNRTPYAELRPVDLATSVIPGTKLVSSSGLGNAQSLIDSKIHEGVTLAAGRSSAVIRLSGQQNIHTAAFNNDGAAGKVTVSGSVDNKDWSVLGSAVFSSEERVAQIYFATTTVKYITLSFDSAKGGTIRSFEIFGDSSDRDYDLQPRDAGAGGSVVDLASAVSGARAIYAFPTPTSIGELNSLHSVFKFPRSHEKYRTIVYDLRGIRSVKHFTASYSLRPMRVEVFAFEALPEKRDWRGKLTLDPSIFSSVKPVAVGEDAKGEGHIRITPDSAVSAGYIALRFEQDYQNEVASSSVLPEFRFTKAQGGANDDLTVGSIEFQSDGEYAITRNNEYTGVMLTGRNIGAARSIDPYTPAAVGSSASSLQGQPRRDLSLPQTAPAGSTASTLNGSVSGKSSQPSNTPVQNSKKDIIGGVAASTAVGAVGPGKTVGSTAATAAPYTPGEAGSSTSKLVKSFSNKFEAGSSKKNNHGNHCDHCYYCNRGGRCGHCGGHDDDHDSDHNGHDDNDHNNGGGGGGNDHDDHGNDHGNDHGGDHGPPMTP